MEAFALALSSCDAKLVIAGYPTKQLNLLRIHERIAELGLGDRILLDLRYIPVDEVGSLMDLATVVVYPYLSSTQSGSLQVAYTFSKPVIVTEVGGLPEVVVDGKSGFLVPSHSPSLLAEKIVTLVNDPGRARTMGQYARQLASTRFAWDTVAKEMMDVYREL